MRQFTTSIAVIALLSLSLAACGGGSTGTDAESIKIGVLLPLAGPVAQTAGLMKNVAEMTAAQINAAGGVDGKNIDIEVYDTKTDPAEAAKQAQRAITQDRVTALIGAFTTPETLAVADVAERSKVVLIAPSAATPAITADKKYVFRTAPVTGDLAEGMMQVAKALGDTNGALMYDSGGLGLGAKDPIEAAAAQEGVTLTGSVQYPLNASDVSAQVSAAAKDKPGAVFIAGSAGADHGVVAKAMVEQGLKVPFIGLSPIGTPDAIQIAEQAYTQLPGVYTLQCTDQNNPNYQKMLADYNAAYPPVDGLTEQSVQTGVALEWIAEGLGKTGGEGGERLASALEQLPARETAGGRIGAMQQFTADDHDAYGDNYLVAYKVVDGKLTQADIDLVGK
ncbi:ABC transporter substrate-binding protein [Rhodococcus baikonurensis]|uniref:ABC transporter substrate-binding protein n=1 Tax=Rhodococcus baikonurensis TaxID=172041 RepID=UPI0037A58A9E